MHSRFSISGMARIVALALLLMALCAPATVFAAPPNNDDVANATVIATLPFNTTENTSEATTSLNDPYPGSGGCWWAADHTVWFTFTPTQDMIVTASTDLSGYSAGVTVYEDWMGSLTQVGSCWPASWHAKAGSQYYLMVSSTNIGDSGNLVLSLAGISGPANDDFNNATVITSLPYNITEQTQLATQAYDDPYGCEVGGHSVWFAYTPATVVTLLPSTAGSTYGAVWNVYTGSRGALNLVAGTGGPCGASNSITTVPGTTYYIMVSDSYWMGNGGDLVFSLRGVFPPSNDDFNSATAITSLPFNVSENTVSATSAADDPTSCGSMTARSVWFKYTPTQDMLIVGGTTGSSYQAAMLGAFTGSRGALTQAGCGAWIEVKAGTTYYIMVTDLGLQATGGDLVFSLRGYPKLVVTLQITGGTVDAKTGAATLKGTMTCSRPAAGWIALDKLGQPVGRVNIVSGPGSTLYYQLNCNGPTPWQFTVAPTNGKFAGGKATASLSYSLTDNESGQSVAIVPTDFETQLTSAKTK